jgi:NADH-quinone oxidoreductase subunit A
MAGALVPVLAARSAATTRTFAALGDRSRRGRVRGDRRASPRWLGGARADGGPANVTSSVADRLLRSAAMLSGYAPILFFFGICAAFAVFAQLLNAVLGPKRPSPTKDLPYESGVVPRESARRRFSVSFYVTAMLFIIFDVESIFLFPWATIVRELKVFGIVEMAIFIATLLVGLLYVWRKGALRWD